MEQSTFSGLPVRAESQFLQKALIGLAQANKLQYAD
jgi:hypothetical protein